MDKQLKAYRFRIYPNATQRQQLAVEFGNARFVWNVALFARQQARLLHGRVDLGERVNRKTGEVRKVTAVDSGALDAAITQLSREPGYEFLKEGTRGSLTQTLIDQDKAFKNFFEGRANQSEAAREREDAAARYHERVMREQNTRHAPHAARPEGDIKGSRDPAAWWTDPKDRDPAQPAPERQPPPEPPRPISPAEAFEKLAQARKTARTMREREERRRAQEQERQPGRSIADDWIDEMLNKKDGPR